MFCVVFNAAGNLIGMVHQQLAVIHSFEHLNMGRWAQLEQMLRLRFGHECLFGAVPEVDIGPVYCFQLIGIDRFVTVQHRPPSTKREHLAALVKQHIKIV